MKSLKFIRQCCNIKLRHVNCYSSYNAGHIRFQRINRHHCFIINSAFSSLSDLRCTSIVAYNLSDIGEGIKEVALKEWFVKVGDNVKQFDNICEVQSDKASVTITSRYDGKIVKLYKDIDEIIQVGSPLVSIEIESNKEPTKQLKPSSNYQKQPDHPLDKIEASEGFNAEVEDGSVVLAIPMVRKLAKDMGINLGAVKPTRPDGRITKEDVMKYTTVNKDSPGIRVEKIKGLRKAMVKSMNETLKIPQFCFTEEVEVSYLVDIKERTSAFLTKSGNEFGFNSKLSLMPYFVKSVSMALSQFPILNSRFNERDESIEYVGYHNIGIAMDSPAGLIVPNLKGVQGKSVSELATELDRLTVLGRAGKLGPTELSNGTFTLSNIGSIGGIYANPLILPPEVAICALGRIRPVVRIGDGGEERDGMNLRRVHVMNVCLSADHRIVDGATAARFVGYWKELMENPYLILLKSA